jgi:predicted nucleic acid-binding protein
MTPTVLDAYALMAYVRDEPGADKVAALFQEADEAGVALLMTSINVGEVLYSLHREDGKPKREAVEAVLPSLPIRILPVDLALVSEAATFKATRKMSYPDCVAAALAKRRDARVVTGDPEFHAVEKDIHVRWL